MFRKKTNQNNDKLEANSKDKLPGLESITSIFENHPGEVKKESIIEKSSTEELLDMPESDLPKPSTSKSVQLIQEVQKLEDRTIKPFVDYNEGHLFYPILSKVGDTQEMLHILIP